MEQQTVYKVSDYIFDPTRKTLTSLTNYKVKNLKEKEADVLKYFILHSHRVIGREEFSQAIWKNTYAKSPKFIITIQKILKRPKKCIFTFT